MSRVGNSPVIIPDDVSISIKENIISADGPKGKLDFTFNSNITVENDKQKIIVNKKFESFISKRSAFGAFGVRRVRRSARPMKICMKI